MPEQTETFDSISDKVCAALKRLARLTGVGQDVDQAQSKAFAAALQAYSIPDPVDLNPASEQRNILNETRTVLESLNDRLNDEGAMLDHRIRNTLARQSDAVQSDLEAFENGLSPLAKALWASGNAVLNTWDVVTTVIGPDKAQIPRSLTSQLRSITIFIQYLMTPTGSHAQMLDMTVQRSLMILPGTITYTIAIARDIYGSKGYIAGNITSSLALLIVVVILMEKPKALDDRRLKAHLNSLVSSDIELAPSTSILADLDIAAEELEELRALLRKVATPFRLGDATSSQLAHLNGTMTTLLTSLRIVARGKQQPKEPNPDRLKKYGVGVIGAALVATVLLSTIKNPALFASNLQWAIYYLYRLTKSAEDSAHTLRHTSELFCNAGAVMLIALPLVSAPLLQKGPDVFEKDRALLTRNTALLMAIQSLAIRYIAPLGLALLAAPAYLFGLLASLSRGSNQSKITDVTDDGTPRP